MNAKRSILTHDMNDIMVMIQVAQANVLKYTKSYLWVSYLWVIYCIFVVLNHYYSRYECAISIRNTCH